MGSPDYLSITHSSPIPHSGAFYLHNLNLTNRQVLSFLGEGWAKLWLQQNSHTPLKKTDVISEKSTFFNSLALKKTLKYIITHCGHQQITGQNQATVKQQKSMTAILGIEGIPSSLCPCYAQVHKALYKGLRCVLHAGEEAMPDPQEDA